MNQKPNPTAPATHSVGVPQLPALDPQTVERSDFLDLLFANRNKAYGAYDLRRGYNKRMGKALLITAALGGILLMSSFLAKQAATVDADKPKEETVIRDLEEKKDPELLPPPPPPQTTPPPQVRMENFTPPVITPDNEVKPDEMPPDQNQLENAQIALADQTGIDYDGTTAVPNVDEGRAVVEGPTIEKHYGEEIVLDVQVEAEFPGGNDAWRRFLLRNLNAQVPTEAGAGTGRYTVHVKFIVDKEGNVSDVQALTHHGFGVEAEAVRAIRKSGKWTPALQNGHHVKAYRTQSITFEVNESE